MARAARARRDPQLLLDDRARARRLEPDVARHHRRAKTASDYVIDGHKWFTTAADGAAFAIVMAVTNPDARAAPAREPDHRADRHARASSSCATSPSWATPATTTRATPRSATRTCACRRRNLLGAEGAGFLIAQERLGPGRIHHCMRWIGICERVVRPDVPARGHARDVARQDARHEADRAGVDRREPRRDRRRAADGAARRVEDRDARASTTRARRSRSSSSTSPACCRSVVDRAIQVHGALGITDDTPLAYFYRHERGARIYDGPDEVHKMVVAKRILTKLRVEARRERRDRSTDARRARGRGARPRRARGLPRRSTAGVRRAARPSSSSRAATRT